MEATAFKLQATIHAEAQTERTRFSPTVTFLLEPRCALQLTLLLIGSKPGRAFIFPLYLYFYFFSHKETLFHCFVTYFIISNITASYNEHHQIQFQVEVSRH